MTKQNDQKMLQFDDPRIYYSLPMHVRGTYQRIVKLKAKLVKELKAFHLECNTYGENEQAYLTNCMCILLDSMLGETRWLRFWPNPNIEINDKGEVGVSGPVTTFELKKAIEQWEREKTESLAVKTAESGSSGLILPPTNEPPA